MICPVCGEEMKTVIGVDLSLNIEDEGDSVEGTQCTFMKCECGYQEPVDEEKGFNELGGSFT